MMLELATVPQGMGRILDKGIALYKATFLEILGIGLIMCVTGLTLYILYDFVLTPAILHILDLLSAANSLLLNLTFNLLVVFSYWSVFFLYFNRVYILKYANTVSQQDAHILSLLRQAFDGLFATFVVFVVWCIILVGLGLLPLGIAIAMGGIVSNPGIAMVVTGLFSMPLLYFLVASMFWLFVITIDKETISDAISRSNQLVWGNWWRTMLFLGIVNILLTILWLLFTLPFPELWQISISTPDDYLLVREIVLANPIYVVSNVICILLSIPFLFATLLPYYHDLKLRKDGTDLAARINAI